MKNEEDVMAAMKPASYAMAVDAYRRILACDSTNGVFDGMDQEAVWALVAWYLVKYDETDVVPEEVQAVVGMAGALAAAAEMVRQGADPDSVAEQFMGDNPPDIQVSVKGGAIAIEAFWNRDVDGIDVVEHEAETADGGNIRWIGGVPNKWKTIRDGR